MPTWYSGATPAEQARLHGAWSAAPIENEELLGFLVETARLQVITYAPEATTAEAAIAEVLLRFGLTDQLAEVLAVLDLDEEQPAFNLVYAQLQQIKNLWSAGRADENGNIGGEGFSYVPRPLDKTIKGIIRPTSGDISAL